MKRIIIIVLLYSCHCLVVLSFTIACPDYPKFTLLSCFIYLPYIYIRYFRFIQVVQTVLGVDYTRRSMVFSSEFPGPVTSLLTNAIEVSQSLIHYVIQDISVFDIPVVLVLFIRYICYVLRHVDQACIWGMFH